MKTYINRIATAVPETCYEQSFIRDQMKRYIGTDRRSEALIHRIYNASGIDKRHSVVQDFARTNGDPRLFFQEDDTFSKVSTERRNELYTQASEQLLEKVGNQLLQEPSPIDPDSITHVITVSCTGFYAPGPDYTVVRKLGLSPSTERYNLGFMGCYAAFPALRMARSFCRTQPDARVLIICLELCTLHLQDNRDPDSLIAASVFADGAAGLIVSNQQEEASYEIEDFSTTLTEQGEEDMAWTIGDTGFRMVLSSYVPQLIESNLQRAIEPLLKQYGLNVNDIDRWALHPGGRAIVDKVEQNLELRADQLQASRTVLSQYGNMSSATVLFVLKELLNEKNPNPGQVLAMAFGPGLTIDSALLKQL